MEDVNKRQPSFLFRLKLGFVPQEFSFSNIYLHLVFKASNNTRDKVWKKQSLFNSDDLAAVAIAKASYFVMQSFVED